CGAPSASTHPAGGLESDSLADEGSSTATQETALRRKEKTLRPKDPPECALPCHAASDHRECAPDSCGAEAALRRRAKPPHRDRGCASALPRTSRLPPAARQKADTFSPARWPPASCSRELLVQRPRSAAAASLPAIQS